MGASSFDEFSGSELLKRAMCMTIINVGELVKTITPETKALHPNVPWKDIAGFRDITAHRYQTLRMEDVYNSIKIDFPEIKTQLQSIIE